MLCLSPRPDIHITRIPTPQAAQGPSTMPDTCPAWIPTSWAAWDPCTTRIPAPWPSQTPVPCGTTRSTPCWDSRPLGCLPDLCAGSTLCQNPRPLSSHPLRPCRAQTLCGRTRAMPHWDLHLSGPARSLPHQDLHSLGLGNSSHEIAVSPSLLGSPPLRRSRTPALQAFQITAPPVAQPGRY
jgi:hypothetical protein